MKFKVTKIALLFLAIISISIKSSAQNDYEKEYKELQSRIESFVKKEMKIKDTPLMTIEMSEQTDFDYDQLVQKHQTPIIYADDEVGAHTNKLKFIELKEHKQYKEIQSSVEYVYGLTVNGVTYPGFTLVFLDKNNNVITYFDYVP